MVQGFHRPVLLNELGQLGGGGLLGREAGDGVDGLGLDLAGLAMGAAALDLHRLHGVREPQAGADGAHLQPADLGAAVPAAEGADRQRDLSHTVSMTGHSCGQRLLASVLHATCRHEHWPCLT